MKKVKTRVCIVPGFGARPDKHFFAWLKKKLPSEKFDTTVLDMPRHTKASILDDWLVILADAVGIVDENTIIVGHSFGGQVAMRFLSGQENICKHLILVGAWLDLEDEIIDLYEGDLPRMMRRLIMAESITEDEVRKRTKSFTSFLSKDDKYVSFMLNHKKHRAIGARVIPVDGYGHFLETDEIKAFPALVALIKGLDRCGEDTIGFYRGLETALAKQVK